MSVQCVHPISVVPRISWTNVAPSSKHDPICAMSFQSKSSKQVEQARSHLCHVGSVCSSHLCGTTHLVDKRGTLEQARPNLCHVFSVKVEQASRASTIQFVPCRFSAFIPSRWYHASRGQTWSPRASLAHFFPSTFSQSVVCVSLNPRASTNPSVPCRFSVFIPSLWRHASRGQTWHPRASTTQSVPCLFSQRRASKSSKHDPICAMSVQCVHPISVAPRISWTNVAPSSKHDPICAMSFQSKSSKQVEQARSNLCHVGSVRSSHLGGTTHLVDKRGALEQAWPTFFHLRLVKVLCVFLLTLEQARTHLCHVGSVCSSHLCGATHLVDKRGTLEQARPNLCHVFSVKGEQASRASTIPSVPCRFSVFISSRWHHASRGQTWHPRASMAQCVPCLFSQSLLCVSRSHLCHVGSVCSSHLGGTTHLVDKRGTLEQARPNLCHVFSVKVEQASRASTILSVPCRFSVFIPSRWHHASRGQTWHPRASMAHFFPSTFSQSVVCVSLNPRASTIPSVPCRFSVFISSRWHHASRGQTWHPRASMAQCVPCLFSQSLLCVSRSIPFVPCRLSVFIPSRWYHASRGQTWHPRASMAHFFPSTFSQSVVCVSLNPRANTIPSVPSRLSVFIPSRWYHASRGQTWHPRASTTQSVPCLFSKILLCVSLNPRASTISFVPFQFSQSVVCFSKLSSKQDPICAMLVHCVPLSVRKSVSPSNRHDTIFAMSA